MSSSPANPSALELETISQSARKSIASGRDRTSRIFDAWAPVKLWHLSSLDAPTVAVVWSLGFGWAAGVRLPFWVPVLIALGTWAVYIGDRLLDARSALRSGRTQGLRERHFFHWRHRRALIPVCASAASIAATIVLILMPAPVRRHDSVLALAALAYFSGVHSRPNLPAWARRLFSKELLVGVLFAAGCALPALSRIDLFSASLIPHIPICAVVLLFASLAWLNCHAIDCWESNSPSRVALFAVTLGVAGILLAAVSAPIQLRPAGLIAACALSALLIALLDHLRTRLTPLALRAAADLVLLTPLLFALRTP